MQIVPFGSMPSSDRTAAIRKELADAVSTIEGSSDTVHIGGTSSLSKPTGGYVEGEVTRKPWSQEPTRVHAISREGDSHVVIRSEILAKNTTGIQVAAAVAGGVFGHLLFGRGEKSSLVGQVAGAALAAWGAKRASEGPGERLIERVQTTPEGVLTERITVDEKGNETFTAQARRTAPPPPFDVEKAKEAINNLKI